MWIFPVSVLIGLYDGHVTEPVAGAMVVVARIWLSSRLERCWWTMHVACGMDTVVSIYELVTPQRK